MRLLHCTDVLPGRESLQFVPPEALYRGQWVHRCVHLANIGKLDADAAKASAFEWWGYVEAHWAFLRDTGARVVTSSLKIGGPGFGYIGELDEIVDRRSIGLDLIDLKCGQPEPWHGLQTAAYEHAYRTCRKLSKKMQRHGLHLSADGTYQLVEHKSKDDLKHFMAYLSIAYFEIQHGLREWPALREGETA